MRKKLFPGSNKAGHGSKAALTEPIYALQTGGVLNHGQTPIREIAENFEKIFQAGPGNYYHCFNEIRLRKKNRSTTELPLLIVPMSSPTIGNTNVSGIPSYVGGTICD
jgi:hypothetical protein